MDLEKIAIAVPSYEEYLRLNIPFDIGIGVFCWESYKENTCINFDFFKTFWGYAGREWHEDNGYTIISVDEYLKMKENELKEDTDSISDTNPKRQFGLASIPLHLWSPLASAYGSLGLYNGSLKYGRNNFKATPVEASIYIAAAMRHLSAWAEGEEYDPADGVPNLGGVLANIAILLEARAAGTLVDDRQMGTGYLKEREHLKEIMKNVTEIHKDKNPRHYTIADNPKE